PRIRCSGVAPKQAFQRIGPCVFAIGKVRDRAEALASTRHACAPRKLIAFEIVLFAQNDAVLLGVSHVSHTRLQFNSQERHRQESHACRLGGGHPPPWRRGFYLAARPPGTDPGGFSPGGKCRACEAGAHAARRRCYSSFGRGRCTSARHGKSKPRDRRHRNHSERAAYFESSGPAPIPTPSPTAT